MAVKGPKAPGPGATSPADPTPGQRAEPKPVVPSPPLGPSDHGGRDDAPPGAILGEGRIGDPTVDAEALMRMGSLVRSRHVMTLLARRRRDADRTEVLREVGDLLLSLDEAEARRILFELPDAGRIVDLYPLELLAYVHERRAVKNVSSGTIVLNKRGLEAAIFTTDKVIRIKVPLALKMRAFAVEGGNTGGYCLVPGPPGAYHLQLDEPGTYPMLLRGELRKKSVLDRLIIRVEDPPES